MLHSFTRLGWQAALLALSFTAVSSCHWNRNSSSLKDHSVPNATPMDKTTIDSQLKRYVGQTEFMNVDYGRRFFNMRSDSRPEAAASGAQRAVQESDVFKVGKAGAKLLYVLNDYRGLQVISFANGADKPELVGRVAASGNYPTDMYFDEANNRLIVLERNWYDSEGNWDRSTASRLVTYDVADATAPKIASVLNIEGEISDSRLVGDVLYVATSVWPEWSEWQNGNQKGKGQVHSFKLAASGVSPIEESTLNLPVSSRENMNIVEVEKDGKYQYFLVAILSDSAWGWWDRQSVVEVVDISDAQGHIKPLMTASAKGLIKERSSTHIKNNTLIVASNYRLADNTMRVAVETFTFPTESSNVISENEAQFRKLYIEREMNRLPADADRDAALERLTADANLGIKGVFVKTAEGKLRKLMADSVVTTGDSTGLSADIQDVRFTNNLMYVFWVPTNMKDPLDIFDVSAPEAGVRYLKRELFEGWIERSIPVSYQGHDFIIGLGWINPTVNNETNRRVPQAVMFEVVKRTNGVMVDTLAQTDLLGANVWADFNAQDKFMETKFNGDGTGSLLFQISQWNGQYITGGKLVGFDLNAAVAGDSAKVFAEGGLLTADAGWLKRVFTNSEISKINTLTNTQLGVFNMNPSSVGVATDTFKAMATLELARDVVAYATLQAGGSVQGVQIISEGNSGWWNENNTSVVKLRLVKADRADAEQKDVASELVIKGTYQSYYAAGDTVVLVSNQLKPVRDNEGSIQSYDQEYTISQVKLVGNELKPAGEAKFTEKSETRRFGRFDMMWWPSYYASAAIHKLASGKLILTTYTGVIEINLTSDQVALAEMTIAEGCVSADNVNFGIKVANGGLFLTYGLEIVHPDEVMRDLTYVKNYVLPVSETANGLSCGKGVNVPGQLLSARGGTQLVTTDNRVIDIRESKYEYDDQQGNHIVRVYHNPVTAQVLVSLANDGQLATLKDMYDLEGATSEAKALSNGGIVLVEKTGQYGYAALSVLGFENDLTFNKETHTLGSGYNTDSSMRLVSLIETSSDSYLAIVADGRKAQVLSWKGVEAPAVKKVSLVDEKFNRLPAVESFLLNGWFGYGNDETDRVHFSAEQGSFEIVEGLSGVKQVYLAE